MDATMTGGKGLLGAWTRRRRMRWGLAVALLACVLPVGAMAQDTDAADEAFEMGMEALTRRGCQKYGEILRLDEDQKEASQALFDGYVESVRSVSKELQASMKELQEKAQEGDFTVFQTEWPEKMKSYQDRMIELQDGYFEDLKSLLRDDQVERWPRLERYRLREELMQMGMVSGSGVDLVAVADRLKIDTEADPELAAEFERYEVEVDRPLVALKAAALDMQEQAMEGMSEFDPANPGAMMERYEKMMEKLMVHAREVRDINRRFERTIVPMLSPEQGEKFEAEFNLRSFPRVYRKSSAMKAIAAAEGFSDLTPEQRERLAGIRSAYARDAAPANRQWADEIERKEDSSGGGFMQMMMEGMGDENADDPVAQARKARRELDAETRERVEAILTDAQKARLPEVAREPSNPWEDYQALQEDEIE